MPASVIYQTIVHKLFWAVYKIIYDIHWYINKKYRDLKVKEECLVKKNLIGHLFENWPTQLRDTLCSQAETKKIDYYRRHGIQISYLRAGVQSLIMNLLQFLSSEQTILILLVLELIFKVIKT